MAQVSDDRFPAPPAAESERVGGPLPQAAAFSPARWWRSGLIALAIVVAILLALQLLGGWPGTDVLPGTPVAMPQFAPGQ